MSAEPTGQEKALLDALNSLVVPMVNTSPKFKGMFYGESGAGKTVLAMELAHKLKGDGKIIYIDSVEGWVSLLNHPGLIDESVMRMTYQGLSQLDTLIMAIVNGYAPYDDVTVIVHDELSVIAKLDLDRVLEVNAKKEAGKDPDTATWPDMNANTQRVRRVVTKLLQLPVHQIILAHQRDDVNEKGKIIVRPDFMPKLSKSIRESLHMVGHMTAKEVRNGDDMDYVRTVQTHPTSSVIAKSRIGGLPVHSMGSELEVAILDWLGGKGETIEVQDVIQDTSSPMARNTDDDPVIIPSDS